MRAPLIRATDVRGARVAVPLEPGDTVDAARARLAAAYGHDDARAVIGSIKTHPNVSSVDIKGVHAWVERFGSDDAEVVVVGFVKVKAKPRRLQPRPSAATAVDARAATTEGPCTSLASIERASTGANASTARETTDDACAELALAAAADATARAQFPLPASLETLHVAYVALCKACLFLSRQGQQPSWRVASQAVHASLRLTLEDARAMETLCPSSIRLINRRRRRLSMDDAVDATANANDDDETIVDVTAPEDADGSGFHTPMYLNAAFDAKENASALAVHGARRSARSIGTYARDAAEMTNRYGVNFHRITERYARAFRRGLLDAVERAGFSDEDASARPLRDFVDAVREIRERERVERQSLIGDASRLDDRPPAPPRTARVKKAKMNEPNDSSHSACRSREPMTVDAFIEHLKSTLASRGQIVHSEYTPNRPATREALAEDVPLSAATVAAFASVGLDIKHRLFSHQARAVSTLLRPNPAHVVVSTGTASGKSVCYNIPVVNTLLDDPRATALYIFPTKALARDQLRALRGILAGAREEDTAFDVDVFDGDTPDVERNEIRLRARCVVTNPDMLHVSVLPSHSAWTQFLSGLRFVVVDEAHAYGGVFGSNVAMILRRLRRICLDEYGSAPKFIISSATVANPREHARDLIGVAGDVGDWSGTKGDDDDAIDVITEDGAPRGAKTFLLWNPALKPGGGGGVGTEAMTNTARKFERRLTPIERGKAALAKRLKALADAQIEPATDAATDAGNDDEELIERDAARTSPVVDIAQLLAECVQHNLRCIAFCKTRKLCELVLVYTREILRASAPELADKIASYRAGYDAAERRGIENSLFAGNLLGVASTNALELGIDVGSLDVTLHLGFPGSVASLRQQSGRAGRREDARALSVYVAFDGPLDQHFMRHPRALFDAPLERAYVDVDNPIVLERHLACAAYERVLFGNPGADEATFGPRARDVAAQMERKGKLFRAPCVTPTRDGQRYMHPLLSGAASSPASDVRVRMIEDERFDVVDASAGGKTIASIEASKVNFEVYPGAVYMHQGKSMLCTHLDVARRRATVRHADVKYFTRVKHQTTCSTPGGDRAYEAFDRSMSMRDAIRCDEVSITTVFTGFSRVARGSQSKFDSESFACPRSAELVTVGAWLRVPDHIVASAKNQGVDVRAGIHAASHAILNVLPLRVPAGENDVGCECFAADLHTNAAVGRYKPHRIVIYDKHSGGVGIASRAREHLPELISLALTLVNDCACVGRVDGCPLCVQRLTCDAHNARCDKSAAKFMLDALLGAFDEDARER